jgi:hypothetical protein
VKSGELISFAEALERRCEDRGKHLTYVSDLPGTRAVTIPCHGNKDVNKFVKNQILDNLEGDLELHEAAAEAAKGAKEAEPGRGPNGKDIGS